jgi:hypothetical protein
MTAAANGHPALGPGYRVGAADCRTGGVGMDNRPDGPETPGHRANG